MIKKPLNKRSNVYVRIGERRVLKALSDVTRLSQAELISEIFKPIGKVLDSLPDNCDRVTFGVYEDLNKNPKRVSVFFAPIFSGGFDIPIQTTDKDADLLVKTDLEFQFDKADSKNRGCGLNNCGMHPRKKVKVKA